MNFKEVRRLQRETFAASRKASPEDKARALEAKLGIGDESDPDRAWVYSAFLNLLHRGATPTEKHILEESKRLYAMNEAWFANQRAIRERREAA